MSSVSPFLIDKTTRDSLIQMMGEPTFAIFVSRMEGEIGDLINVASGLIDARRFEDAALAAHKVAGSAAVLGAEGLRQAIIRFEMAARDNAVEVCRDILAEIETHGPGILDALRKGA